MQRRLLNIFLNQKPKINTKNIVPFFQTIVSISLDNEIKNEGIEILARIKCKDQYLPPSRFLIKHSDNINYLNKLTITLLLKTLMHLEQTSRKPKFISFNLCPQQLQTGIRYELIDKLNFLHSEFQKNDVDLVMEITEDEDFEIIKEVTETLKIIKDIGIKIAVDDYGKYFSSPSRVALMANIDILKVDKSLINSSESTCLISMSFLKHVLDIAKILNCKVIIEGVEKKSQLELLHDSTIWYQGYYFSQPRPIFEL